jgi:hypothetical protein
MELNSLFDVDGFIQLENLMVNREPNSSTHTHVSTRFFPGDKTGRGNWETDLSFFSVLHKLNVLHSLKENEI